MAQPSYGVVQKAIFRLATEDEIEQETAQRQGTKKSQYSESYFWNELSEACNSIAAYIWKGPDYSPEYIKTTTNSSGIEHSITNDVIAKAILNVHRYGKDLFNGGKGNEKIVDILQMIFPDDTFEPDDYIFSCSEQQTKAYHSLLRNRMQGTALTEFAQTMKTNAQNILDDWHKTEDSQENIASLCKKYAAANFASLLFGKNIFSEELAQRIDELHTYIIKKMSLTATSADDQSFAETALQLRKTIETIVEMKNLPLFEGKDLTLSQKKALLFVLVFAGQDTTASILCYMLWKLASTPGLQDSLYKQIQNKKDKAITEFFVESMRQFTPAHEISRRVAKAACIEYHDGTPHYKVLLPNEVVAIKIDQIAEGIGNNKKNSTNSWSGFGAGKHLCPGKKLAEDEVKIFFDVFMSNYIVETKQEEVKIKKLITTTFTEPVFCSLKKRNA